jgi:hypothetical protein
MFIDIVPNGRSAPAVLLRESYREGKRVRKRTIGILGQLPPALIDGLRVLLKGGAVVSEPGDALEILRSLPHGHVAAVIGMMRANSTSRACQAHTAVAQKGGNRTGRRHRGR